MNDLRHLTAINAMQRRFDYKLAIILLLIVIGIASNATRSYLDFIEDGRTKRIRILVAKVDSLTAKVEACESGTPMPLITSVRIGETK